jgi:dTDP-4-dehydrorhamnose reductase
MRIAVAGARGQLGAAVVHECAPRHDVVPLDRARLDLTDDRAVADAMAALHPDVIVNCAGYNDVDGAEDHAVAALEANAFAVRALARAAGDLGATLVQFSSDFVFDGTGSRPYTEDDRPNPRSTYAASKLLGEWFAFDAPRAYVLRVESLFGQAPGGPSPKGSLAGIVNAIRAGNAVRVFADRTVSPTHIGDAAAATRRLVESSAPPGLYHCVNSGATTWLGIAEEVARLLGVAPRLEVVRLADVRLRAERPRYCVLSNEKLALAGVRMPAWQDALARFLKGA